MKKWVIKIAMNFTWHQCYLCLSIVVDYKKVLEAAVVWTVTSLLCTFQYYQPIPIHVLYCHTILHLRINILNYSNVYEKKISKYHMLKNWMDKIVWFISLIFLRGDFHTLNKTGWIAGENVCFVFWTYIFVLQLSTIDFLNMITDSNVKF